MESANLAQGRSDENARILQEISGSLLGFHAMILMNDFKSEPDELRRQELAAVERVFCSGQFILGNEVQQFEEAWAKFCGAKFCAGVANGREAIERVLPSRNLGP